MFTQDSETRNRYLWLRTFLLPVGRGIAILLLVSLLASALVLVQPLFTKTIIDDGILAENYTHLWQAALGLMVVGLVSTLISGVSRYLHTRVSAQVLFRLRSHVYGHLQTLSPSFYARARRGDLMSRLDGDVAEVQRFIIDGLFSAVSGVIGLLGALALLMYLSVPLTAIVFCLLPLQWFYLKWIRPRVEYSVKAVREGSADVSAFFVENLSLMKLIQSSRAEAREQQRLQGLQGSYLNRLLNLQWVEFASHAVPSTLTSWSRALVFLVGGYWVIEGQMALGALIAFSTYLGMAVGPVNSLLGLYISLARVKVSLQRVEWLTQTQAQVQDLVEPHASVNPQDNRLSFCNLSFTYPQTDVPIFHQASADIPAAARVAVVSPSGSGKSTLVDLLLRHYDPQYGRIECGGVCLTQMSLSDWRRRVAVVDQHTQLFRASVLDNIRYANPQATDAQAAEAIEAAQLTEWVATLPQGVETLLGDSGLDLSGGQRQRIALARAFLQNPDVLILDEATASLDRETEQRVLKAIEQRFSQSTRLMICHRLPRSQVFDFVLRIERGKIVREPVNGEVITC